jgi:hypothetical protein
MNLTASLDVATGLVLTYLVLSLFCTAVNELISTVLSLRAKTLKATLRQLIDDPKLQQMFYDHGLIDGARLAAGGGKTPKTADARHPSYFTGRTVASALVGSLTNYLETDKPIPVTATIQTLRGAVEALPVDTNIRDVMTACLADAGDDVEAFRDRIADWFDDSMARLSGAYTRKLQYISLGVGFALAVAFNANTLSIADHLWNTHDLGAAVSQIAGKIAAKDDASQAVLDQHPECTKGETDSGLAKKMTAICAFEDALSPLPLGWKTVPYSNPWDWLFAFAGWAITAVALMKGAPFWFDLLQKVMNFRAAGDKPKGT